MKHRRAKKNKKKSNNGSLRAADTIFLKPAKTAELDTWRVFKILSEFVQGFEALQGTKNAITFFGSSRLEASHPFYKLTYKTSQFFARKGFTIMTGGGPGLMAASNRGAFDLKKPSIGLGIDIPLVEPLNPYTNTSIKFDYFFVRKVMLVKYSVGFVIMPGGLGTLDELFEALTLITTKKIEHFPIVLMGKAYWKGLVDWMHDQPLKQDAITQEHTSQFYIADTPQEAYRYFCKIWGKTLNRRG